MYLAIVIVILIICAVIAIKEKFNPPAPPIEDLDEHLKQLSSLPDKKTRQKYLNNRKVQFTRDYTG